MDASIAQKLAKYLWKMFILNLNFQGEGQFYANFLFYVLVIQGKCLAFLFLSRG